MPRVAIKTEALEPHADAVYEQVRKVPTGSTLLDCVLGGGWGMGRICNLVGDKSSGKTLLAIEACANFAQDYPAENIRYLEAESAFDRNYAESLGFPSGASLSGVGEIATVEEMHEDMVSFIDAHKRGGPVLYVVDSLDALSDKAEQERALGDASYGTSKARALSEIFRRSISLFNETNTTVLVISQVRDKIGVTFGETKTRSGGRALDFYASQVVWLAELAKITREYQGVKRTTGTHVRARNRKNKVGKPYREADLTIMFNYGVDDEVSMLEWLKQAKGEELFKPHTAALAELKRLRAARNFEGILEFRAALKAAVLARWEQVEQAFAPELSKYPV